MRYLSVSLILLSVVLSSQEYLIGPDGTHRRIEGDVEALPATLVNKGHLRGPAAALLDTNEFELRWPDRGEMVDFPFETEDSIAQWFTPLAACSLKKILLYPLGFEGSIELYIYASNYAGEARTGSCADDGGWVGTWVGTWESREWLSGNNPCFNTPPIGEIIWDPLMFGGWVRVITEADSGQYVEIDLGGIYYPDMGSAPFFFAGEVYRVNGQGFGAWSEPVSPYHSFKYYASPESSPSGNAGWHIRSLGLEIYAVVQYYEDIPPFIQDVSVLGPTLLTEPREVRATIYDANPGGGPAGVSEAWLHWLAGSVADSVSMIHDRDSLYVATLPEMAPGTEVTFWIAAADVMGNWNYSRSISYSVGFVGLHEAGSTPDKYSLYAPHPNPFNPTTTIRDDLPQAGRVSLAIYDVLARQVAVDSWQEAGTHEVVWSAADVPSGIYFVRMVSGAPSASSPLKDAGQAGQRFSQVRKVVVLR